MGETELLPKDIDSYIQHERLPKNLDEKGRHFDGQCFCLCLYFKPDVQSQRLDKFEMFYKISGPDYAVTYDIVELEKSRKEENIILFKRILIKKLRDMGKRLIKTKEGLALSE